MDCCYLYILWCNITYNNDDEELNDWGRDLVTFINVWFCVDVVFNLDLHEVVRMIENKQFVRTNDIGQELLKLMAILALQFPIGINYELWRELHQIKGDW